MKNVLVLVVMMFGFAMHLGAQSCTPCPPQCAAICKPAKGTTVNAALPFADATNPVTCTPEQLAACAKICTPEQIAACLDASKMSKKDLKACQKVCDTKSKSACVAPAAASIPSTEKQVDRMYHTVPSPSKS